jgi:hypothetical protein
MRAGAFVGLLILSSGLPGIGILAAGEGYAQESAAPAGRLPTESSAASAATSGPGPLGDGLLLQASPRLGKPSQARARPGAFKSGEPKQARSATATLPGLRLQPSPSWQVSSVAVRAKPALTAGELNRDGLVRANRMQLRDGTIFLEGGGRVEMPAPRSAEPGNTESRLEPR